MKLSIPSIILACALPLGACNQSTQKGTTPFFDAPTEAGLLVAGTAASYDPTGVSSFAVAQATRATLLSRAAKSRADWEQYRAEQLERISKIPDRGVREMQERSLQMIGMGSDLPF